MERTVTATGLIVRYVTGYEAVREVLGDADRFSSRAGQMSHVMPTVDPYGPIVDGDFTRMDGAPHQRLRGLLVREIASARHSEAFRGHVTSTVHSLLDALSERTGPVDLLSEFAKPLSLLTIVELVGVPLDMVAMMETATASIVSFDSDVTDMMRAIGPLLAYAMELIRERRANPGTDLISRLIVASDRLDQPLRDSELTAVLGTVLGNGFESTAGTLTHCVLCLFEHPDELSRLRAAPAQLPVAIEELLRHQGVGAEMLRVVTRDTELAGTRLTAGEFVVADIGSACFDPHKFDRPEELDLARKPNPHLAFGHGSHRCPGELLARLELTVALDALLRRVPTLRLAVPLAEIDLDNGSITPGPVALPVTWDRILPA